MIKTRTVFVLGAGASAPYKFDTGGALLERARAYTVEQIAQFIQPLPAHGAPPLHDALVHTGDLSIDAMLETRGEIQAPGKALIARFLLQQEANARREQHTSHRGWYRTVISAMEAPDPAQAVAQPVRFITFNYERSLEYCLWHAWRVKFSPDKVVDAAAVRSMFIHVHGQLGSLPELGGIGAVVHYGGSQDGITDADVLEASRAIKIVHEPLPNDPQFAEARAALAAADRVIFLGFGFAPRNVARLQLAAMKNGAALFISATGLSHNQQNQLILPWANGWRGHIIGGENDDAFGFLRMYPQALT